MDRPLAVEVVDAIADAEGVDACELDLMLEDFVDTDVLELLSNCDRSDWTFRFELPDYDVVVTSEGVVFVDELDAASPTVGRSEDGGRSSSRAAR